MKENNFDPNNLYRALLEATNATGQAHFASQPEEVHNVQIRPDKSINPGNFKPDPFIPGGYKAHPVTIRAMRPDIFIGGDEMFEDLEVLYKCIKCQKELDLQFWKFCPYCEAQFPKDL